MELFNTVFEQELKVVGVNRSFPAGTILLQKDSYVKSIPVVLSGSMRVIRQDDLGKEILLYYIQPGESCIMSFLAGIHEDPSKIRLIVEEDAQVIMVPISAASKWITQFPEWAEFIFKLYHRRFEELLSVIDAVAFQKLDDRIVILLKKKAVIYQSNEFSVTHQQLAEELGTTREVVSRLLKQLEKKGFVSLSRSKISILSAL